MVIGRHLLFVIRINMADGQTAQRNAHCFFWILTGPTNEDPLFRVQSHPLVELMLFCARATCERFRFRLRKRIASLPNNGRLLS